MLLKSARHSSILLKQFNTNISRAAFYSTKLSASELTTEVQSVEEFNSKLKASANPVIVDFHAHWCPPCKMLDPQLKQAIEQQQTFNLLKVNIDELPELAQKYEVSSIPQVTAIFKNEPISGFVGFQQKPQILKFFEHVEALANSKKD